MTEPHGAPYDHHVGWSICPFCGALQDGAANMTGENGPKAGDVAMCFECGEWAEFDDKGGRVKITDMTKLDDPDIQRMMRAYQRLRREHPERWPRG